MQRILTVILLLITCTLASAQKIRVEGTICDAETGERLPYATIKVENDTRGTITNHEGDFVLLTDSDDVLCVQFTGYDRYCIRAAEMPQTIRLKPCQTVLSEVTVVAEGYKLLLKANKLLRKQFRKHEMECSQYFFRLNTAYETVDVTEGFLSAQSMGNLRGLTVVKGYHARKNTPGAESFRISDMNFHHMLELGPWMNGTEFWSRITSPLNPALNATYLQNHYSIAASKLADNQGAHYYVIYLDRSSRKRYTNGIVTGKLYLDAETLLPLRFDGQVEDIVLVSGGFLDRKRTSLDIHVALTFDHSRGFTEVASMACTMRDEEMGLQTTGILFSVDDIDLTDAMNNAWMRDSWDDNLINIIDRAGYDHQLWESSNIIKRTSEEERILGGEGAEDSAAQDSLATQLDTNALLYRISGEGLLNDSYIFGSFHLAPINTIDIIYGLREAFDEVEQVCGEKDLQDPSTPGDNAPQEATDQQPKAKKLSNVLTWRQLQKVKEVLRKDVGLDFDDPNVNDRLNKLSPAALKGFLVHWKVTQQMKAKGFPVTEPVYFDGVILTMARGKGKKVLGLEERNPEEESRPNEPSIQDEVEDLMHYIDNIEHEKMQTELLLRYYFEEQDPQQLLHLITQIASSGSNSEAFEALNFQRSANWLKRMPEIMRRGSTLFVVGAAHLCGERGLLQGLHEAGYRIEAVKNPAAHR